MAEQISLKKAEQKVFQTATSDGLWDIFVGCYFLIFVIAPYLSARLGDFWSSIIFLPFWGLVYLATWMLRKYVVRPRVGVVKFGVVRKARLTKFTLAMLAVNTLAFLLGLVAALSFGKVSGQVYSILIGLILMMGFSLAGYFLDFKRLYFYGLLVGFAPMIGEWLWTQGWVTHHGFPITFGITSGFMILTGMALFAQFLRDNPLPREGNDVGGA
jgi:hypothetical protein